MLYTAIQELLLYFHVFYVDHQNWIVSTGSEALRKPVENQNYTDKKKLGVGKDSSEERPDKSRVKPEAVHSFLI